MKTVKNNQCLKLHEILRRGKVFDFKSGDKFKDYLETFKDFPRNGIYLMFEKGEIGHGGKRIVRIGINTEGTLINRLNGHINGAMRSSVFRRHLFRILGSEKAVTKYIKNRVSFCVISCPDDLHARRKLEENIIGMVSNCNDCRPLKGWLGLKSVSKKIRESGLWNVQHVFGDSRFIETDLPINNKV